MAIYKLSPQAKEELRRIWRYGLITFGETQADAYYDQFFEHFKKLAEQPYLYPAIDDIMPGYRRSLCGVDNVYYRINHEGVEIMRILRHQDVQGIL